MIQGHRDLREKDCWTFDLRISLSHLKDKKALAFGMFKVWGPIQNGPMISTSNPVLSFLR